ncbi:hypothetical protein HMPREF7215_1438 [Pyramidobacter piscolens W5455]|uniref:Uncharacterized protein n=1 Tax=Pyramidobacter piscolens W5455 TaxID=352165 RepID=A0ABP2HWA9_9BACT|nr:hypothetical protein HMPREF7215_1438 [Pyramidobacter piscolens W5455]
MTMSISLVDEAGFVKILQKRTKEKDCRPAGRRSFFDA